MKAPTQAQPNPKAQFEPVEVHVIGGLDGARLLFDGDHYDEAADFSTFDEAWSARKAAMRLTVRWFSGIGRASA